MRRKLQNSFFDDNCFCYSSFRVEIPLQDFVSKEQIGIFQQSQGRIAYEVFLYSDSTFYLPGDNAFIGESYGDFRVEKDTVYFETTGGDLNLCKRCRLNRETDLLVPTDCSNENSVLTNW